MVVETHFNCSPSCGSSLFGLSKKYFTVFDLSVKRKVNEGEWHIIFVAKSNYKIVLGL